MISTCKYDEPIDNQTMKTISILSIASFFFLSSCEQEKVVPAPSIFRTWEEIETEGIRQFEGSTFTSLTLNEDYTFQLAYHTWSDVRIPGDPCHNISDYFAKGNFTVSKDSIFFDGCASDPSYRDCIVRCDGESLFKESYMYKLNMDSLCLNPAMDWSMCRILVQK